jgi:hypothetical protein
MSGVFSANQSPPPRGNLLPQDVQEIGVQAAQVQEAFELPLRCLEIIQLARGRPAQMKPAPFTMS